VVASCEQQGCGLAVQVKTRSLRCANTDAASRVCTSVVCCSSALLAPAPVETRACTLHLPQISRRDSYPSRLPYNNQKRARVCAPDRSHIASSPSLLLLPAPCSSAPARSSSAESLLVTAAGPAAGEQQESSAHEKAARSSCAAAPPLLVLSSSTHSGPSASGLCSSSPTGQRRQQP